MITIQSEIYEQIIILHFHGVMVRQVLKDVEDAWSDHFDQRPETIAFDFKELTQIDSICINHIFRMARLAEENGIKLIIYDVFDSLRKIFEVIKLDKVIPIMTKKQFETLYLKDIQG